LLGPFSDLRDPDIPNCLGYGCRALKLSLQPPIYRCSFPGTKRPGREAAHSPPSRAQASKEWRYASLPPCALASWAGTDLPLTYAFSLMLRAVCTDATPGFSSMKAYSEQATRHGCVSNVIAGQGGFHILCLKAATRIYNR
jgi:hypothetical protein